MASFRKNLMLKVFNLIVVLSLLLGPQASLVSAAGTGAPHRVVDASRPAGSFGPAQGPRLPGMGPSAPANGATCAQTRAMGSGRIAARSELKGETLEAGPGLAVRPGDGAALYNGVALATRSRGVALNAVLDYDSLYRQDDAGWGYGWTFSYDWRYEIEEEGIVLWQQRSGLFFASDTLGGFISPSPAITMTRQGDSLLVEWSSGRKLFFDSPAHKQVTRWEQNADPALTFAYNGAGQLQAIQSEDGQRIDATFQDGRLRTLTDASVAPPRQLRLDYNAAGDLTGITEGPDRVTTLFYDAGHRLVGLTDPQGAATSLVYSGEYVAQFTRGDVTTSWTIDEEANTVAVNEETSGQPPRQWMYAYNYQGILESTTYPDGSTTRQVWDEVLGEWRSTDQNGHTTTMLMADNHLTASRDPLGNTTTYTYSPTTERMTGIIDPNGAVMAYDYDAAGRIAAMTDPQGGRWTFEYNDAGQITRTTDPLSRTSEMEHDDLGYPTVMTDALGIATFVAYDAAGRLTATTDGNGHTSRVGYDGLDRPTALTDALGHATTLVYAGGDKPVQITDPNGNSIRTAFDAAGRAQIVTDALGSAVRMGYDAWGNLAELTDERGRTTAYQYDDRDRLIAETNPLGQTTRYRYDAAGNRTGVTDARGQVITQTYDAANRPVAVDYAGSDDDRYTFYDPAGRATVTGDADVEIQSEYDAAGRVLTASYTYAGAPFAPLSVGHVYNRAGQATTATLPGGDAVAYTYNPVGLLAEIAGHGARHTLTYDAGRRLTQIAPDAGSPGARSSLGYDAADRVTALTNAGAGGDVFDAFTYAYDPVGNVLTATRNGAVVGYSYDAAYRLTGVSYAGGWERYSYDATGNRLTLETPGGTARYQYDAANQLTTLTDTTGIATAFAYDANGNMARRTRQGQTIAAYTWDAANRLARVDYPDGTFIAYTYGPDGQRLSRRGRDGALTYYVYDGLNLVEERDAAGNLLASYVYGDELDRPYSMKRGGQVYYYLYDRQGSVVGLSDGAGTLVARYEYDAWGNLLSETGAVANPFRYTGREWDAEAQLYYLRARYYDPALGRFISRDPLGMVDGTNRYSYVSNNAVNYVDVQGTQRTRNTDRYQNENGKCGAFCDIFLPCFTEHMDTAFAKASAGVKLIVDLAQLIVLPSGVKDFIITAGTNLLSKFEINLSGTAKCLLEATKQVAGITSLIVALIGMNSALTLACASTPATGVGAAACPVVAMTIVLTFEEALRTLKAGLNCALIVANFEDTTSPTIEVYNHICDASQNEDSYAASVTENCELSDVTIVSDGEIMPQTLQSFLSWKKRIDAGPVQSYVLAWDKSHNKGEAEIPACNENCHSQPTCTDQCEKPAWFQTSCLWECYDYGTGVPDCSKMGRCWQPIATDDDECQWRCGIPGTKEHQNKRCGTNKCGEPVYWSWNDDICDWDCKDDEEIKCCPDRKPEVCSQDNCGNPVYDQWNYRTCEWECPTQSNNPCIPDDNRSPAASQRAATAYSNISGSRVAILDNGFALSLQDFLARQGVAADRIEANFSPEMAARYPVLLIPSGGLNGYAGSESMRLRLAQYVENGGTLIAFAQVYGNEFRLLPGGALRGYGWDEDINCHSDSAYISTFAPMVAGQYRDLLSLNIDGFFTAWPTNAEVILGRVANGMPALLAYRYGAGRVIATTAYADMAAYQGQGTGDEEVLLRDLLRWAALPDAALESYGPADSVTVVLTATNRTTATLPYLQYYLFGPAGSLAADPGVITLTTPLAPGASAPVSFTVNLAAMPLAEAQRYGIWSVDVELLNEAKVVVQEERRVHRFTVTRFTGQPGGGHSYQGKPYAMSVTSESESYPYGSPATFTYNVFNHSDRDETFKITWLMIHHSWSNVPGYSGSLTVTVPAHSMGSVASDLERVVDLDRVRARLYLNGQEVVYAERGFWAVRSHISQMITSAKTEYLWGERPVVTVTARLQDAPDPISATTTIVVKDPEGQGLTTETITYTLSPTQTTVYTRVLPPLSKPGYTQFILNTHSAAGDSHATKNLYLPPAQLMVETELPAHIVAGAPLILNITNTGGGASQAATVYVSMTNPTDIAVWSETQPLTALNPGQEQALTFVLGDPGAVVLGDYVLHYKIAKGAGMLNQGQQILPAQPHMAGNFDRASYQVRKTAWFTLTLDNQSYFDLSPTVWMTVPALGITLTQAVALPQGYQVETPLSFVLTDTLPAGEYDVQVALVQNTIMARAYSFVIPPSQLEAALLPDEYHAGGSLTVAVKNVGGVDTTGDDTVRLYDFRGRLVASQAHVRTLFAGEQVTATLNLSSQFMRGNYQVTVKGEDQGTGRNFSLWRRIAVEGLEGAVSVHTDKNKYLTGESIAAQGQLTVSGGALLSGTLDLQVTQATPFKTEPTIERASDGGDQVGLIPHEYSEIVVDPAGNAYALWMDWRRAGQRADIYVSYRPAGGTWQPSVLINGDDDHRRLQADITMNAAGDVCVIWDDDYTDIYVRCRSQQGWGKTEHLNDSTTNNRWHPRIALDNDGNAYAVWEDQRNVSAGTLRTDVYFAHRPAGGEWSANERLNDRQGELSNENALPDIAVDASGNAYCVWGDYRNYETEIYSAYRPAGGDWGTYERVSYASPAGDAYYATLAVDAAGNAYAVWTDERNGNGNQDTYFAYRPAGGTWGANERVNDDTGTVVQWYPHVAVDASGNAYAVWADHRNGAPDLYFAYRPVTGTWEANVPINEQSGSLNVDGWYDTPQIAADASGNAYVAWADTRDGAGADVAHTYFAYRPSGGAWGPNERLSDASGGRTHQSPAVAVDSVGTAHVVWDFQRGHSNFNEILYKARSAGGDWTGLESVSDDCADGEMVSYWRFEEGSGNAVMDIIDGNDGTMYGTVSRTVGMVGDALYFDGGSLVDAGGSNNLNFDDGDSFSFEAWVRPVANGGRKPILDKYRYGLEIQPTEEVRFWINDGTWAYIEGNSPLQGGQWYHLVGVYQDLGSEQSIKLYINGELKNQMATSGLSTYGLSNLYIGYTAHMGGIYFNGAIDEAAVYDKPLTPDEIQWHYQNSLAGHDYLYGQEEETCEVRGGATQQANADIAVDAADTLYALWQDNRNGGSDLYSAYRPADDSWQINERVNDASGRVVFDSYNPYYGRPAIAAAPAGDAYAIWTDNRDGNHNIYAAHRPPLGMWSVNEKVNDVDANIQNAPDIATDGEGNAYAIWHDERNNAQDIYFAYRPAGGPWQPNEKVNQQNNTFSAIQPAIAVDSQGNAYAVWMDTRDGGYNVYFAQRPANGVWSGDVQLNDSANRPDYTGYGEDKIAIASDFAGNVYVAWIAYSYPNPWETIQIARRSAETGEWTLTPHIVENIVPKYILGLAITADRIGNLYLVWRADDGNHQNSNVHFMLINNPNPEVTVWRKSIPVTTSATQAISETIGELEPGRYQLVAALESDVPQTLARSSQPFDVYPEGVALTLRTGKEVYRPGEPILVSGEVTNTAALAGAITLTLAADAQPVLTRTFTLAAGQAAAYTVTLAGTEDVHLVARAGAATVAAWAKVSAPQIAAALDAPALVGRAPFSATLTVSNTGQLALALLADFAGQVAVPLTLGGGEQATLQATLALTDSGPLTVTLSGDAALTLTQTTVQGEVVTLAGAEPVSPTLPLAVWAGPATLPFTLTNAGLLPASLPVSFTLDGQVVFAAQIATLPGQVYTDVVWLDLTPGEHVLTRRTPYESRTITLTAFTAAATALRVESLQAPARLTTPEPVTVTIANRGPGAANGAVQVQAPGYLRELPVTLAPGEQKTLTATLDGSGVTVGGFYTLTVETWGNGQINDSVTRTIEIPTAALQVAAPPLTLSPGVTNTWVFSVSNTGGKGAVFSATLDLAGMGAYESPSQWCDAGDTVTVSYQLNPPDDIEAREQVGHIELNGARVTFTYTVAGYQLDMSARLSSRVAAPGETITATLNFTDTSGLGRPLALRARLGGAGEPQTAPLTFTGATAVSFVITAPEQDALLSYGLYHPQGRSLLLDTLRLYVQNGAVRAYPGRDRYTAGETLALTAIVATPGTLTWNVLGVSHTLALAAGTPASWSVPLAGDLLAGAYHADYTFAPAGAPDGEVAGQVAFEVEGDRVEIHRILAEDRTGNQHVTLQLVSRTALDNVVINAKVVAPDGATMDSASTTADLTAGSQRVELPRLSFTPDHAGLHRIECRLAQNGRELAYGWEGFDVAGAALLGIQPSSDYYLPNQPVALSIAALNDGHLPATLRVELNGALAEELALTEAGYQAVNVNLGALAEGGYTVTARLDDGVLPSGELAARVQVVSPKARVDVSAPGGQAGWHTTTPDVQLSTDFAGGVVAYRWDGGNAQTAGDGQAGVPADDGRHTLSAWVEVPGAGTGPVTTTTLRLDRAAPIVTASVAAGTPVTLTLAATDGASGVSGIRYQATAGEWITYTGPVILTAVQTTTVLYQAWDQAGNQSFAEQVGVPPVSRPYGLALAAESAQQAGAPGTTVAYALTVRNAGYAADRYTVAVAGNDWPVRSVNILGPVNKGRNVALVVAVAVPPDAALGSADAVAVTVASENDPAQAETVTLTTTAAVYAGVAMNTGRSSRSGAPGTQVNYSLRITNRGNVADTFNLALSQHAWPVSAPQTVGSLNPGQSADVAVLVTLPAGAAPDTAETLTASAISQLNPDQTASIALVTTVACVPAAGASFTYWPLEPQVGETVFFSATTVAGAAPVDFAWDFGDDQTAAGQFVTHVYANEGEYPVSVAATNCGAACSATHNAVVSVGENAISAVTIQGPATGTVNEPLTFNAVYSTTSAILPVNYAWLPEPGAGQGTAWVTYTWATAGTYTLQVAAESGSVILTDEHVVVIGAAEQRLYLPVVLRQATNGVKK